VFSDVLRVGATGKFLYEKILIDEASGVGFDFGAQYDTPVEHLTVGFTMANIGSMSNLRNEETRLPTLLRIGTSYSTSVEDIGSTASASADFVRIFREKRSLVNVGGEIVIRELFAARAGYQLGSEGRGFTSGIGLYYKMLGLDYAYARLSADLGNTHTISLLLNL
jgi:hypothetical protein